MFSYIWEKFLMGHLSTLCKVNWIHFILIKFHETLTLERIHIILICIFGTLINVNKSSILAICLTFLLERSPLDNIKWYKIICNKMNTYLFIVNNEFILNKMNEYIVLVALERKRLHFLKQTPLVVYIYIHIFWVPLISMPSWDF